MPLSNRARSHFEPEERRLGGECFRAGRVDLQIDGSRVRARVARAGGEESPGCRVGVDVSRVPERRLEAFCECRRFAGGHFCRHIFAVLLALDEAGPEHRPPGKDRLGVRRGDAASWEESGTA